MQVIADRWEVAEPAEGCEGVVESDMVTVIHRELGCEPNQKEGCHEGFGLVDDGEFIDNKEDRVHIRHGDHHIIDESRDGCNLREVV